MAEQTPEEERKPIVELRTSPEIERILARQMEEIPRLALTRPDAARPASVFGLIVCCG